MIAIPLIHESAKQRGSTFHCPGHTSAFPWTHFGHMAVLERKKEKLEDGFPFVYSAVGNAPGAIRTHRHRIGGRVTYGLVSAFVILFASVAAAAEPRWPGAAPDCWADARFFHSHDMLDIWKDRTLIRRVRDIKPKAGTYSPNSGYHFTVEGGRPTGSVTIYAEKDYLLRIEFSELFGLADVKWVNEKLLFMRPWWGRILGTDLIYDVEAERIVYAETVTDGYLAYQQFRESCPMLGCDCIKKKVGS